MPRDIIEGMKTDPLLTRRELAAKFSVKPATIHQWEKHQGLLVIVKARNLKLYDVVQVAKWLKKKQQEWRR